MKIHIAGITLTVPQIPKYFNGIWKSGAAEQYIATEHPHLYQEFKDNQKKGDAAFHRNVVSITKRKK